MKKLILLVVVVPAAVLAGVAASAGYRVWKHSRASELPGGIDAIVIMGAAQYNGRPSDVFRARLDAGRRLFDEGRAPLVFVLGGKQPGDKVTEAQAGTAYLEEDLPASRVIGIKAGDNTYDSLRHLTGPAAERSVKRIVVVSDRYHLARSKAMADSLGFETFTWPSGSSAGPDDFVRETLMLSAFRALRVAGSAPTG